MDDTKNKFTAYLVRSLGNAKCNYVNKRDRINAHIRPCDAEWMNGMTGSKGMDVECINEEPGLCMDEVFQHDGWRLTQCVSNHQMDLLFKRLTIREREIVARRIFLEQSFAETGKAYGLTEDQAKHVYYYAISKMRRYADGI